MAGNELSFVIEGGTPLSGTIETNRSKNGAVALLAASLLNKGTTTLTNVPKIEEVNRLLEVLRSIGVVATWDDHTLTLTPPQKLSLASIDTAAAIKTRSILMFIGSLVHAFDDFQLPQSGGCTLGLRSIRQHLFALERFGVHIEAKTDHFRITNQGLAPAEIVLFESSDTATINALLAAASIPGTSVIKYASANYQVQEVCGFLRALGIEVTGIGSTTITVSGKSGIDANIEYSVGEDPTDAMFFIAAAAATKSELTITHVPIEFLEVELSILEKMGLRMDIEPAGTSENGITKLATVSLHPSELVAFPEKIHPLPYPGLNIDNLPFFAVIATQATGTTLIHDWVYEKRAIYYTELDRFGAETQLLDPHRIEIQGPRHLRGTTIVCPPALRPATILVIGALVATGRSTLTNIYSINRGYEDLATRIRSVGGRIEMTGNGSD